ncbi:hypothetical protein [Methylobacterium fujisawaense]|uniref:hypothetical protein n=1 Tax=Methylobacterium fujisawaense TaxID=107400 RepID=UPI00313B4635
MDKPLPRGAARFHVYSGECSRRVSERRWWNLTPRAQPDRYFNRFMAECAQHLGEPADEEWLAFMGEHIKSGRLYLRRMSGRVDIHLDVYGEDAGVAYRIRWPHKMLKSNLSAVAR